VEEKPETCGFHRRYRVTADGFGNAFVRESAKRMKADRLSCFWKRFMFFRNCSHQSLLSTEYADDGTPLPADKIFSEDYFNVTLQCPHQWLLELASQGHDDPTTTEGSAMSRRPADIPNQA
jgi:hypothetical protein